MDMELSTSACSGQISSEKLARSQMRTIGLLKKKMYTLPSSKKPNRIQQHTVTFGRWRQEDQEFMVDYMVSLRSACFACAPVINQSINQIIAGADVLT